MVVEILEEGCEESTEKNAKTDRDEMRQSGEDERGMLCSSSFSSTFTLSSSDIDVNGSDNLLWNEIDLAERYLVSAMNEDAASTSTAVLQTLSSLMHSSSSGAFCSVSCINDRDDRGKVDETVENGKSDHAEMLECAGMVLLQSYRSIGRVGEFFEMLGKLSIEVDEWPLILLETGACLQISDDACPAARTALEEFLEVRSTCLLNEKYAEVIELYVIKVLAKGLQDSESAMKWVERANLTEERRLFILKQIQFQMEQAKSIEPVSKPNTESTTSPSGGTPGPTLASFDAKDLVKVKERMEKNDVGSDAQACPGADESSITSKSLALLKRFKISDGLFSLKILLELALARLSASTSAWQPFSAAILEARALRFGTLVALFLFIFLSHRHPWRRLLGKSFSALRVGLSDLWQLVFVVQINPLAL